MNDIIRLLQQALDTGEPFDAELLERAISEIESLRASVNEFATMHADEKREHEALKAMVRNFTPVPSVTTP